MADITNRELAAKVDDLRAAVQGLVGRLEYAAYQNDIEHQLGAMDGRQRRDFEALSSRIDGVNGRIDDQVKAASEHRLSWRTVLWTGLLPAAVVLLGTLLQLWLAKSGG